MPKALDYLKSNRPSRVRSPQCHACLPPFKQEIRAVIEGVIRDPSIRFSARALHAFLCAEMGFDRGEETLYHHLNVCERELYRRMRG